MKKYLVIYQSFVSAMEQMAKATPEQAKAGMAAWMTWGEKNKAAIVDMGSPVGNPQSFKSGGLLNQERHRRIFHPAGGFAGRPEEGAGESPTPDDGGEYHRGARVPADPRLVAAGAAV